MKVYNWKIKDKKLNIEPSAAAIGNFDGVHLGHQKVLEEAKKLSTEKKLPISVLTFEPHPREFFSSEKNNFLLQTNSQKIETLRKHGIDNLINLKFDKNLRSLKTYGWNAIEILVKDTEQLFLKLKDSQYFRIVGEPVYISDEKSIKAMQVLGPSNELIYFTSIEKPEKTGLTIEGASAEIDRIFIMILGVDNIESLRRYYSEKFNIITSDPAPFRIRTLSNEHGLPIETKYPLSIATLSEKSLIEIDEYPKASVYRENMANELPPGIAMVSFYVDSIPNTLPFISPVAADEELPYNKRKSAVIRGPVGELIEIIET